MHVGASARVAASFMSNRRFWRYLETSNRPAEVPEETRDPWQRSHDLGLQRPTSHAAGVNQMSASSMWRASTSPIQSSGNEAFTA